jgi:hypothetical protein
MVPLQAAVFRRKAGEVQGTGQLGATGEPVSSTPFGRLVADIDSSGEPQVSLCPIMHLEGYLPIGQPHTMLCPMMYLEGHLPRGCCMMVCF